MAGTNRLIVHEQSKSPVAEAYRILRTNIRYARADHALQTVMFTSAGPGEGKSTTAANTAIAFAQSGKRVVILDCDLRKPMQHKIFGLGKAGLTNVLVDGAPLTQMLQDTFVRNLQVVTSGPIPPNPSELLSSERMRETLEDLKGQADLLIVDAPPVIAVTDACVLASIVDGVVLVIKARAVRPEMARKARDLLRNANGRILGAILNRVELDGDYGYYYYYGDDQNKAE